MKEELTIKDLYVSKDWQSGYKVGVRDSRNSVKRKIAPSRNPITIDEHTWYYEEKFGITVVHEIYVGDKYIRTDNIKIKLSPTSNY